MKVRCEGVTGDEVKHEGDHTSQPRDVTDVIRNPCLGHELF